MDFPIPIMPPMPTIHSWSYEMLGSYQHGLSNSFMAAQASAVYPAAARILYLPFALAMPATVVKLWCYNGATAAGDINMGIYDITGVRLVSIGTTAQSGTNTLQLFDITDTLMGPGDFYLAIIASSASATFFRTTVADAGLCRSMGMLQEAGSGSTLPTTATFAAVTGTYIPQIGLSLRADL